LPAILWPGRLQAGEVVLRDVGEGDVAPYVAAFADDPDLGRLLGMDDDPTPEWVQGGIARAAEARAAGRFLEVAVAASHDDAFLGSLLVHSLHARHRRAELGFWLIPAARGRGVARGALELLIDWAWDALDVDRLEMSTTTDNERVPAVAAGLGFAREGTMRARNLERGERVDVVMFGLLREQWLASRPAR
jgi:ribosomal-protein-alanine N-acetyltransferase